MIKLQDSQLDRISVHVVGNKELNERLILSKTHYSLKDELLIDALHKFFTSPFNNKTEFFSFEHSIDLRQNEIYSLVNMMFEERSTFQDCAMNIARHLYSKTDNAKIKGGELCVVYFENCIYGDEVIDAIGIFKSERKEQFLRIEEQDGNFELIHQVGMSMGKLDKGCLIFDVAKEEGYRVCVIDTVAKDEEIARYWKDSFLRVQPCADDYHYTSNYLSLCKEFISNEAPRSVEMERADQIDMLNRSLNYFKENEYFDVDDFSKQVLRDEEVAAQFKEYKTQYQRDYRIALEDDFEISVPAVKKQAKIFKSIIKLDKNFHIYIHGDRSMVEQGTDDETGRKYYKLYYETEE